MAKDDLAPRDGPIIPASYRIVGPDAQTPGSAGVIEDAADEINAFLHRQRMAVGTSIIDQHRAQLQLPSLDIEYVRNQGQEMVTFRPRVSRQEPVIEAEPEVTVPELVVPSQTFTPTTLYLLVLYSKTKIAWFPMSSLSYSTTTLKSSASLTGTADLSSKGAAFGTDNILTNQLTIGTASVILTGADMTGKSTGDMLCLSTTKLTDVKVTANKNTDLPQMNGDGQQQMVTVYTGLASYSYDGKAFTQAATATAAGYAFGSDGTTYFPGNFGGVAALTVQQAAVADASAVSGPLFESEAETQIPTAAAFYITGSGSSSSDMGKFTLIRFGDYVNFGAGLDGYANRSFSLTTTSNEMDTSTIHDGGAAISDTPVKVSVTAGYTYYGVGAYGQAPQIVGFKWAITPTLYPAYDVGLNASTQHLGSKELTDLAGALPRAMYDQSKNAVSVTLDMVQSTSQIIHNVTQSTPAYRKDNPNAPGPTPSYSAYDPSNGVNETVPYPDTFSGSEQINSSSSNYTQAYNIPNTKAGMACASATSAGALASAAANCLIIPGPNATESNSSTGYEQVITESNTGALATPTYTYQTTPAVVTHTNSGGVKDAEPGSGSATDKQTPSGSLSWNSVTIDQTQSILFYPFPLSLAKAVPQGEETCFYTLVASAQVSSSNANDGAPSISITSGTTPPDVHTPYGKFTDTFTPWLHIANAQHYMQGFSIGANDTLKNHLYLDGGDFMDYLTAALSTADVTVKDTDIVAAYMDIALPTVQSLGKITSVKNGSFGDTGP